MADYKTAITKVLKREGGSKITNDPTDPGGLTKYGISQRAFPSIDVKNLTEQKAIDFYKINFWNKIGGDKIHNQDIANLLVDSAVNEGIVPAIKRAQAIVGIKQTGTITPDLIIKLNSLA